jgi:serine/threonine protein kinase
MFAVGCYSSKYIKIEGQDDSDHEANGMMMSIPLKTLSGGASGIDFMHFFERAMKARHLSTRESSLLVINPNEIVLSRIIGEGSFGRVWSGQWRNNDVAVKEFVFAQAAIVGGSVDRHNVIEEIVGEAGIMACLRHPKILELYGCSLTMQAIWIVSELCVRGSLRMVLNDSNTELSFLKKISLALDIADGMIYLHRRSPPIIHRDLKSQNVFITEPSPGKLVAKIGDWGSARAVALTGSKSMTQGVGTACWLAPEVINCAHFSKASDVYAYGIVLWEIFSRQEVYEGLSAAQIIIKVAHEGLRPRVPKDCPWASLMTECWRQNASERPGFNRILQLLSSQYHNVKAATKRGVGEDHGHGNNDDMDEGSSYASVCSYDMSASMSDFRPGSRTSSDALVGDSATRSFTKGVPYMNVHQSGGTSSSGVQRGLGRGRYYQYPSRSGRRSNDGGTREDSDLTLGTGRESANINTLPSSSQAMPLPTASGRGGREGQSDNAQIPLLSQHPNSAATGAQLSDYGTDNSGR